jgi:glutathione synthase/RimK-type ligase-like ATP-grasp enzyme
VTQFDVTLVTCERLPTLTADDQALAAAMRSRGMRVRSAVWSDPEVEWDRSAITVLRSTWDYFRRADEFLSWIDYVESHTRLLNPPAVVRWNHDKHYLAELTRLGVTTIPTIFVEQGSRFDVGGAMEAFGTDYLVIKPTIGGASYGARRFRLPDGADEADAHLHILLERGAAMIQPFIASVLDCRERSLVFLEGRYSHAYLKPAFSAGALAGQSGELPHEAREDELALARAALRACPDTVAYARVDMALIDERPHLMELEVIEPALHFHLKPGSADRFAAILDAAVGTIGRTGMSKPSLAALA